MPVVMIVDDEPSVRALLTSYLSRTRHRIHEAAGAVDALRLLTDHAFDVVICDVHMPGPNGLWLADRIREVSPSTAVILATGDSQVPPVESLKRGVIDYLVKPFPLPALGHAVEMGARWAAQQRERIASSAVTGRWSPAPAICGAS